MSQPSGTVIAQLQRALEPELDLSLVDDVLTVTEIRTGRTWRVVGTPDSIARHAHGLTSSGQHAGVGGAVSPGVALLSIHIGEAVATAEESSTRLMIQPGGVRAV